MRELLFRGQTRKKGEYSINVAGDKCDSNWVCGGVFHQNDRGGCYSIIYSYDPIKKHVVYAETVGEYTGLTDKNGVEIFEHDICKDSLGTLFVVEWDSANARFIGRTVGSERRIVYVGKEPRVEVVGNIFDDLELINHAVINATDNCQNGSYNCDSCKKDGDCIEQGIDGKPRWMEDDGHEN